MSEKIVFANQLRGAAALCVVVNHWFGFYWRGRDLIAAATASPAQPGGEPWIADLAASAWHNSGPLGVALFFLISGFVIPFSLKHHGRLSFLAARALRIYPVYFLAVLLDLAMVTLSAHGWHLPSPLSPRAVLLNALLVNQLGGVASLDMVNWTLAIELQFYLVIALLFAAIAGRRTWPLLAAGALCALACYGLIRLRLGNGFLPCYAALQMMAVDGAYLPFMFIGTLFTYHFEGALSWRRLVPSAGLLFGLFAFGLGSQLAFQPASLSILLNYLYGLVLFTAAYRWRARFRPLAALDGLAAVSYPLYAIHTLFGYVLLKALTLGAGLGFYPALAITAAATLAAAAGLHVTAERWGIAAGRRLSTKALTALGPTGTVAVGKPAS